MTKPVTSVALMMLFEQVKIRLEDPLSKYIPAFKNVKVMQEDGEKWVAPKSEITIWHLLTHTAGLSYGDADESAIEKLYIDADLENADMDNAELSRRLAELPLKFHPGEGWHYSYATDVIGHLVEIISGVSLGEFFQENIFKPLGMEETFFQVPQDKNERFAELYGLSADAQLGVIDSTIGGDFSHPRRHSGGSGLVSKLQDYFRFTQFLLNKGELEGARLLGPKTVELITLNHLNKKILPIKMNNLWPGSGFGLGVKVLMDRGQASAMENVGTYDWGGWASTHFWIDPVDEIISIFLTQYIPSFTYPLRKELRTAVYQAMVD